jgi:hypothetical protein
MREVVQFFGMPGRRFQFRNYTLTGQSAEVARWKRALRVP